MPFNGARVGNRSGLVAVLDIGSSKTCCLIARLEPGHGPRIVGIGHQMSSGVRNGEFVDLDAVEATVRASVGIAEKMAQENITEVLAGLPGGRPRSRLVSFDLAISGRAVDDGDIKRLLDPRAWMRDNPEDREIVHRIPIGYNLDGSRGVSDPRGMHGQRLAVNMHLIAVRRAAVRDLETSIRRCHLSLSGLVVPAYASAFGCLTPDEAKLGATVIDMGGGTTSVAVMFDGELVHTDVIAVGGHHVTSDIARGISCSLASAERLKTLHGSAIANQSDERQMLNVPVVGEDGTETVQEIPRALAVGIVRPRIEEIFEMVRARLEQAGFDRVAGPLVVLTGGASQLTGVREMASMILNRQVRLGRPRPIEGLAEATSGPAFSTVAGLLRHANAAPDDGSELAARAHRAPAGRLGRIGQWIRDNF